MQVIKPSRDLFIILRDGEYIGWNVRTHEQYELDTSTLERLRYLSANKTGSIVEDPSDKELLDAKFLSLVNLQELDHPVTEHGNGWKWDTLSHLFHIGTQNIRIGEKRFANPKEWSDEYIDYCSTLDETPPELLTNFGKNGIQLPNPDLTVFENRSFWDVATSRKTCRSFYDKPTDASIISTLLHAAFGPVHGSNWDNIDNDEFEVTGIRKLSASGGGLHPFDVYPVIYNNTEVEPGAYAYDQINNKLVPVSLGQFSEKVTDLLYGQFFNSNVSVGVFLVGRFDKAWWKYRHSRAYRNVLMDVGHASQTFQLCATALGLQTWISGAFDDALVDDFLEIDGQNDRSALFYVSVGYSENKSIPDEIISSLNKTTD